MNSKQGEVWAVLDRMQDTKDQMKAVLSQKPLPVDWKEQYDALNEQLESVMSEIRELHRSMTMSKS